MKKKILSLLLAAAMLLPAASLAVTEGKVEEAPEIDLNLTVSEDPALYLPDDSQYAGYGGWQPAWGTNETYVETEKDEYGDVAEVSQLPCLTTGEIYRAKALLAAYEKGEKTGDGAAVLNAAENVTVGVYPLDPAQFDGEEMYVILQGGCLSDEELLSIIDAFHQQGLTFDPEGLNYRNCVRGGGIECSRFITEEERERYDRLADSIRRGLLTEDMIDKDTAQRILYPSLNPHYFCGMDGFSLRPYRSMTDDELAVTLFAMGCQEETFNYKPYEKLAWQEWNKMGAPLSMETSVSTDASYCPITRAEDGELIYGDGRPAVYVSGSAKDADGYLRHYSAMFDQESGALLSAAWIYDHYDMDIMKTQKPEAALVAHERKLTEEGYISAAQNAARQITEETLQFTYIQDCAYNSWVCLTYRAQMQSGLYLDIALDPADAKVHAVEMRLYPSWPDNSVNE